MVSEELVGKAGTNEMFEIYRITCLKTCLNKPERNLNIALLCILVFKRKCPFT